MERGWGRFWNHGHITLIIELRCFHSIGLQVVKNSLPQLFCTKAMHGCVHKGAICRIMQSWNEEDGGGYIYFGTMSILLASSHIA
jgi:hypothetical protein